MERWLMTEDEVSTFLLEVPNLTGRILRDFTLPPNPTAHYIRLGSGLSIECSLCHVCIGERKDGSSYEQRVGLLTRVLVGNSKDGWGVSRKVVLCNSCAQDVQRNTRKEKARESSRV